MMIVHLSVSLSREYWQRWTAMQHSPEPLTETEVGL
jgi:hypothetical protein